MQVARMPAKRPSRGRRSQLNCDSAKALVRGRVGAFRRARWLADPRRDGRGNVESKRGYGQARLRSEGFEGDRPLPQPAAIDRRCGSHAIHRERARR